MGTEIVFRQVWCPPPLRPPGTREFLDYLIAIIWSSSMAFIIQEDWLQNVFFFCAGILFYFLQALAKVRPACFNRNFCFSLIPLIAQ